MEENLDVLTLEGSLDIATCADPFDFDLCDVEL
jgi:hypothetical protein